MSAEKLKEIDDINLHSPGARMREYRNENEQQEEKKRNNMN